MLVWSLTLYLIDEPMALLYSNLHHYTDITTTSTKPPGTGRGAGKSISRMPEGARHPREKAPETAVLQEKTACIPNRDLL